MSLLFKCKTEGSSAVESASCVFYPPALLALGGTNRIIMAAIDLWVNGCFPDKKNNGRTGHFVVVVVVTAFPGTVSEEAGKK